MGNFSLWNLRQILNSHMPVAEKSDEVSLASELFTAIASNPDNFSSENKSKLKQGSQPEIPERGSKTENEAKAAWGPPGGMEHSLPGPVGRLLTPPMPPSRCEPQGSVPVLFPLLSWLSLLSLGDLITSSGPSYMPMLLTTRLCPQLQTHTVDVSTQHWFPTHVSSSQRPLSDSGQTPLAFPPWLSPQRRESQWPSCSNEEEPGLPYLRMTTTITIAPVIRGFLWVKWEQCKSLG